MIREPLPFHLFHFLEPIDFEIRFDHHVPEFRRKHFARNLSRFDLLHIDSHKIDEIAVPIIVPTVQGFVLSVYRGGCAVLKVSESLAPDIFAVFGHVDYLGVEWQAWVFLRDQTDGAETGKATYERYCLRERR